MPRFLKSWWFWPGMLCVLGIVGAGYLLIPAGASPISQENCDRIQIGWTGEEVTGLLGSYTTGMSTEGSISFWWVDNDENSIKVAFDDGRVIEKEFNASGLSLFEQMERRVKHRLKVIWP